MLLPTRVVVLHHWIYKTKTETKTEYGNKSMIVRINWFKEKKGKKKWKSCCVCSPSTLSSLSVLHHWISKTKTETKTEYETKSWLWESIDLRRKGKEMKELLCVLTVYDFVVVSSLKQLIVIFVRRNSIQKDVWVMKDPVLLFTVTNY